MNTFAFGMWISLPVLWSALPQFPISMIVNWTILLSTTSPACEPIWIRSPRSKGRRNTMKIQPVRSATMSSSAIASPAEGRPGKVPIDRIAVNQICTKSSAVTTKP